MKVYATTNQFKANLYKGLLEDNGIGVVILNKRDSSYGTFGEIELYTLVKDASRAMDIIKSQERKK